MTLLTFILMILNAFVGEISFEEGITPKKKDPE